MKVTTKQAALVVGLLAAFALGGAAVAGAVQNTNNSNAASTQERQGSRPPRETALTGQTAAKVRSVQARNASR